MNKIFDKPLLSDRIIRLFLAFFCPPLAVVDKGCRVFLPVLCLWVLHLLALGTVLIFGLYISWWLFVECPFVVRLFSSLFNMWLDAAARNPAWIAPWLWSILCTLFYDIAACGSALLIYMTANFVFGLISATINLTLGFVPILIAILSMFSTTEQDALKPEKFIEPIRRNGVLSRQAFHQFFLGANRIALCFIYPPLAVADMGWKKMLLVFFFNLIGWLPGVCAVFFCVVKAFNTTKKGEAKTK